MCGSLLDEQTYSRQSKSKSSWTDLLQWSQRRAFCSAFCPSSPMTLLGSDWNEFLQTLVFTPLNKVQECLFNLVECTGNQIAIAGGIKTRETARISDKWNVTFWGSMNHFKISGKIVILAFMYARSNSVEVVAARPWKYMSLGRALPSLAHPTSSTAKLTGSCSQGIKYYLSLTLEFWTAWQSWTISRQCSDYPGQKSATPLKRPWAPHLPCKRTWCQVNCSARLRPAHLTAHMGAWRHQEREQYRVNVIHAMQIN